MVNHLARGDRRKGTPNRRQVQAEMLNTWVANQTLPTIAVGDYNFDFQLSQNKHDPALDLMVRNQNWFWLYPETFDRTQCNMNLPAAFLDFIFVTRPVLGWSPQADILSHPDDCQRESENSDHKALVVEFDIN
jgi:endonuclease/exonuclease/phosphatase family metal-dependent hydrolase